MLSPSFFPFQSLFQNPSGIPVVSGYIKVNPREREREREKEFFVARKARKVDWPPRTK